MVGGGKQRGLVQPVPRCCQTADTAEARGLGGKEGRPLAGLLKGALAPAQPTPPQIAPYLYANTGLSLSSLLR